VPWAVDEPKALQKSIQNLNARIAQRARFELLRYL
jgi:hypothetical protein